MTAVLPAFVDRLLEQGQDPGEIPDVPVQAATNWLGPLASRLLSVFDSGSSHPAGSYTAHGCSHLPLHLPHGPSICLRLAREYGWHPWPVQETSVVLTMAGTVELEVYQETAEALAEQPQYARSFRPGEVFAVHPGTLCSARTRSDELGLQVLVTAVQAPTTGPPLRSNDHQAAVEEARRILEGVSLASAAGERS